MRLDLSAAARRIGQWLTGSRLATLSSLFALAALSTPVQAQISITGGDMQSGVVNTTLPTPLSVHVIDNGTGMPAVGGDVNWSITQGSATFVGSGASTITTMGDSNGDASVQLMLGSTPGPITVHADSVDFGTVDFSILATSFTITKISGDNQTGAASSPLSMPLVVKIADGMGVGQSGQMVQFTVQPPNDATVNGSSSALVSTDGSGLASVSVSLGTMTGSFQIAADGGPMVGVVFFDVTTTAGGNGMIIKNGGDGQQTAVNTTFPQPLQIRVLDGMMAAVPSVPVTFTVTSANATIQQSGTSTFSTMTDASGNDSVNIDAGGSVGAVTVTADAGSYGIVTFNLFQGIGSFVITGGNMQAGPANSTLPIPLSIQVQNAMGMPNGVVSLRFRVDSGNATIQESGAATFDTASDASGNASVHLVLGASPGGVSVTVLPLSGLYNNAIFSENITGGGTPAIIKLDGDNQSGNINTPLARPLLVLVTDATGMPVNNQSVLFTVANGGATFTANGSNTITVGTGSNGQASAAVTVGSTGGPFQISADAGAPYGAVTFNEIAISPLTVSKVSGDGQTGLVNTTLPQDLVVTVTDGSGTPQTDRFIVFNVTSGNATFLQSGGTSFGSGTGGGGTAAVTLVLGGQPGPVVVTATDNAGAGMVTFNETAVTQSYNIVKFNGDGQSATAGQSLPQPISVRVTDSRTGAVAVGVPVLFSVVNGNSTVGGQGSTQVSTDASGIASTTVVLGSPGTVNITASVAGGIATFTETSIAPPQLALDIVSGNGQSGITGSSGQPLVVQVTSNGVLQANQNIDWAVVTGSNVASIGSTSTTTSSNGQSSNSLSFLATPGAALITATLQSDPRISQTFSVTSSTPQGSGSSLTLVSGANQTGAVGTRADAPFVFRLLSNGTPVGGQTVNFSILSGGGTLTAASTVTDTSGNAATTLVFGNTAGLVTVQASAFSGVVNATATATGFLPALRITGGDNQTAPAGTKLPQNLAVSIAAAPGKSFGKGLGGVNLAWTVVSGGGSLKDAVTPTDGNGNAINEFTLGSAIGNQQVRATYPGGGSVTFTAVATVNGTVVLEIASGNNQTVPTGAIAGAPLVVRAKTQAGAVFAGVPIVFTSDPPNAVTITTPLVITDSAGLASTTVRLNLPAQARVFANVQNAPSTTAVQFAISGGIANTGGLNEMQQTIAQAVDTSCQTLSAANPNTLTQQQRDLLLTCQALASNAASTPAQVANVIQQLSNDEAAAETSAALSTVTATNNNMSQRFQQIRGGGGRGFSAQGLTLAGGNGALPLSMLPSAIIAHADEDKGRDKEVGLDFSRWGFFATGTILTGSRDAIGSSSGFDFGSRGLTAGADYRVGDKLILGGAVSFNKSDSKLDGGRGKLDTSGFSLTGYGSFYLANEAYADIALTYGSNSYDLSRKILFNLGGQQVNQTAKGSPDGNMFSLSVTAGRDFANGAWTFGPYLRGTYTKLDFDSYTERMSNPTGAGAGLALAVSGRSLTSREGVLGGKVAYASSQDFGILSPNLSFEYVREFADSPDNLITRFANDPTGTPIVVSGDPVDKQYFNLGIGLSAVFANGRSGYVYVEHRAGQAATTQNSIALGLRIEF